MQDFVRKVSAKMILRKEETMNWKGKNISVGSKKARSASPSAAENRLKHAV